MNEIKNRQKFRPFAPSVLEEYAHEIFDMPVRKSQFMQFTAPCKFPKKYPAICHVDNTSRVQICEENQLLGKILKKLEKNNIFLIANTSFNISSDPMVYDKEDAFLATERMNIKYLLTENGLFKRK